MVKLVGDVAMKKTTDDHLIRTWLNERSSSNSLDEVETDVLVVSVVDVVIVASRTNDWLDSK